jgi:hypothetical protein
MAIRQEQLSHDDEAVLLRFARAPVRSRPRRAGMLARRRLTFSVALCLLALLTWALFLSPGGPPTTSRSGAPSVVVLSSGETLWDLAERFAAPGGDPRAYVDALAELNHGPDRAQPGARIRLP